jgi:hypothetical protein
VRIPYLQVSTHAPIPSLSNTLIRPRPIVAIRVTGPRSSSFLDAFLDTGADDSVFESRIARNIGLDLTAAPTRSIQLVGRPQPLVCRYAVVELRLAHAGEAYSWQATIAFVDVSLRYPLLGYAGCLQYFDATFCGADHEVEIVSNREYPGTGP